MTTTGFTALKAVMCAVEARNCLTCARKARLTYPNMVTTYVKMARDYWRQARRLEAMEGT